MGYTCAAQQVPATMGFHVFSAGVHRTHSKMALRLMAMFMLTIINHSTTFIFPVISRSSVRANAVLLQTAARMENVPVKLPVRPSREKFSGGTSQTCVPLPLVTAKVLRTTEPVRDSCCNGRQAGGSAAWNSAGAGRGETRCTGGV